MTWPWTPIDPTPPAPKKLPGWWALSTITIGGIASGEAFGTLKVGFIQQVEMAGIPSGEAVGTLTAVYPQNVTLQGIASAEAFGGSALHPGDITIGLQGIASGEAFGEPTITTGPTSVLLTGIASGEAFGSTTVAPGPVDVGLTGIPSGEAVGGLQVAHVVGLAGIPSEEAMGAISMAQNTTLTGIASGEAFGTMTVIGPPQPVQLQGIASSEAFGGSLVAPGAVNVALQGITSGEAFGTPTATRGAVSATLSGIASGEAFGNINVAQNITLPGIASAEAFGAARVDQNTILTGIASAEAFGTMTVSTGAPASASYINAASAVAASVTIPAHQVGDLLIVFAHYASALTPAPPAAGGTVPAWSTITSAVGSVSGARICSFVATATNHTTGTWTNTSDIAVVVVRGQKPSGPIGGSALSNTQGVNLVASPSITLTNTDGTSLLLYFYGCNFIGTWSAAPTGYTQRTAVASSGTYGVVANTKNSSTSDGAANQACNTFGNNSGGSSAVVEVKAY